MTEFLYLSLFLALRGVLGTIAMYWVLTTDFFDLEEKILSTALYVVSLIFIYDICCYVRYKYKRELVSWFCNIIKLLSYSSYLNVIKTFYNIV